MSEIPVVILCGGQGTRMRGQTLTKKELVNVGGRPIIWHVMRIFSTHGFNRFVLTLGYGADQLKRYFLAYDAMSRDFVLHLSNQGGESDVEYSGPANHPEWDVAMVDTGLHTAKASRVARVNAYLTGERFFVAYGDDVGDVNLTALLDFHRQHGRLATITAVQIRLPYGVVQADDSGLVEGFVERPLLEQWINGGFMLFEREALRLMSSDDDVDLENDVLPKLARKGQLMIYRHHGFWQSMNTMKDNLQLEELWRTGAPWKVW
ncbi:MAG: NTP transferase domain-containing protein [Chloroflexota bacterium]|nr:MAG: NTP transferase domain-containing protein [Chloroflexota bacterium]